MEIILVCAVVGALGITFICALTEAAIYSVPFAFVKHQADQGSMAAKLVLRFKEEMSDPITAILVANTAGAVLGSAVVGAVANEVLSGLPLAIFGVVYALVTLYVAEIAPKIIGVAFAKPISLWTARPLSWIIVIVSPLIWVSKKIESAFASSEDTSVSEEEVLSIAAIGTEEGVLDSFEGSVISNVIELDKVLVRDVLTPRVVVFRLSQDAVISTLKQDVPQWSYTRVPVYEGTDSDNLKGYVIQRDIYRELLHGGEDKKLADISRKLTIIPEVMRADQLLLKMFAEKEHICGVVDEHGSFVGIITLEDIIEEIIGQEIVDEFDAVSDMRSLARVFRMSKSRTQRESRKKTQTPLPERGAGIQSGTIKNSKS